MVPSLDVRRGKTLRCSLEALASLTSKPNHEVCLLQFRLRGAYTTRTAVGLPITAYTLN